MQTITKSNQPLPDGTPFTLRHTFHAHQTMHEHLATFWELATPCEKRLICQTLESIEVLRYAHNQGKVVLAPYGVGNSEV